MGVDGMLKKELFYIISEMFLVICVMFLSYKLWDNFDQTDYSIAKYYDNTKEVDLVYESNNENGLVGNNIVVSVHNISDKKNNKDIIFKLNKNIALENIKINEQIYNLKDIYIEEDQDYNYFLIDNINLKGYETRVYFIDLISEDNLYDYQFITEL